jgi:hypothetical protein
MIIVDVLNLLLIYFKSDQKTLLLQFHAYRYTFTIQLKKITFNLILYLFKV